MIVRLLEPFAGAPPGARGHGARGIRSRGVRAVAGAAVLVLALAAAPARAEGYSAEGTIGWGYYELLHVGTAVHLGDRSTLGALVGSNLSANDKTVWTLGLNYAHAVGPPVWQVQLGWKVGALYWSQSDPDYDWKMLSLQFSVNAVRPLTADLSLALDVGAVYTTDLTSDRKQNVNFSHPLKWNGSVCLELRYLFTTW